MSNSHQESSGGAVARLVKKPAPLRIVVPPTEFCPFSTDLTLPITPLSLPTPLSSSCFTFNESQGLPSQPMSLPPTPAPLSCPRNAALSDLASPTSSQFLLMPPTPHLEDVVETAIGLATPAAAGESIPATRPVNLCSCKVPSSTWLSDLGGHTETDRIFRHNLLGITSVDTESSPASTPALSPSVVSPSQVPSRLAENSPSPLARSPPALLSSHTMSLRSSSPARLTLKPTGTDTFPSTLDSLQAWRESVMPGVPQSEEPCSPLTEDSPLEEPASVTATHPSIPFHQPQPQHPPSGVPHISKTRTFMKRAKTFGGRVKQLVTWRSVNKHRSTMDRGVSFRVVTSQDSEDGSVILITAPPPYDIRPVTFIPHSPMGPRQARSRTASEYSSVVQTSMVEVATIGPAESGPGQGGRSRNALRRLSLAALSTIKRL